MWLLQVATVPPTCCHLHTVHNTSTHWCIKVCHATSVAAANPSTFTYYFVLYEGPSNAATYMIATAHTSSNAASCLTATAHSLPHTLHTMGNNHIDDSLYYNTVAFSPNITVYLPYH